MPIKTLGSLGKIRVGRETGNTHISFGGGGLSTSVILDCVKQTVILTSVLFIT